MQQLIAVIVGAILIAFAATGHAAPRYEVDAEVVIIDPKVESFERFETTICKLKHDFEYYTRNQYELWSETLGCINDYQEKHQRDWAIYGERNRQRLKNITR